jgi:hypothetical protein
MTTVLLWPVEADPPFDFGQGPGERTKRHGRRGNRQSHKDGGICDKVGRSIFKRPSIFSPRFSGCGFSLLCGRGGR